MKDVPSDDATPSAGGTQSIRRALTILRILASGQERGVRLTDVAQGAALNRPTAHRILKVLVEEGAAEQDRVTRRYLIGQESSLLGLARRARFPIRAIAEPHLRELSRQLGETTFLSIRNGDDSICIDRQLGTYPVKVLSIEVGARRPLGVGVSGLVLLASLPPDKAAQIIARNEARLKVLNTEVATVIERVAQARELGYVYAPVGIVPGARSVGVPVVSAQGQTVAVLTITAIAARLPASRLPAVVNAMLEQARLIGAKLQAGER